MLASRLLAPVCVLALVTACADGEAAGSPTPTPSVASSASGWRLDDTAAGPAPAVPGAVAGGTVRVYDEVDYVHLDPARAYSTDELSLSVLITRRLTGLRQTGGTPTLVGDLATDTGRTDDGGKTWTYTLREGIAWEDGTPITAAQVKYGLERTFAPAYVEGPTHLQTWLTGRTDFRESYAGPYDGKSLDSIGAPDDRTLVLQFDTPRPDLPFALALPAGAPVKPDKDTRAGYDQRPFASGPYKIAERITDRSMVLVRNTAWRPESDPIRTAYPDRFEFAFGGDSPTIDRRLIAGADADAAAMSVLNGVSPQVLPQVLGSPELLARTVSGVGPGASFVAINTRRVKDLTVRKALMYAWPRAQIRDVLGGADTAEFATTVSDPQLLGYERFDLFGVPPEGDPAKARALLEEAGQVGRSVVYAYSKSSYSEPSAEAVEQALGRAGFTVQRKELDEKIGYESIQDPANAFDVYGWGWFPDWPTGAAHYPVLFDGRLIRKGTQNVSLFDDPAVNAELDEISAILDPAEAGRRWSQLERRILARVPVFPDTFGRTRQLHGPKLGGVVLDPFTGQNSLNGVHVVP